MARDTPRAFAPTIPSDLNDWPRFGQIIETTKDAFVLELRKFISSTAQSTERRVEIPTIEKYATFGDGNDPYATTATILRKYPDTLEALPHIAVMASTGVEKRLNIGPPFIGTVQESPFVESPIGPFALEDGDYIEFRISKDLKTPIVQTVKFVSSRFPTSAPISAATASAVALEINDLCPQLLATAMPYGAVRVSPRGPYREIEVTTNSSANALSVFEWSTSGTGFGIAGTVPNLTIALPVGTFSADDVGKYITLTGTSQPYFNDGRFLITDFDTDISNDTITFTSKYGKTGFSSTATWFIGARDDNLNTERPPKHRYAYAFDLSVAIDILTEDENTRGELTDLVISFFSFFLENKFFTFNGRSQFPDQGMSNETYQIVINPPIRSSSENEFPRPSGDGTDKIYVNSLSVDVTTSVYIDREVYVPTTTTPWISREGDFVTDQTILPVDNSEGQETIVLDTNELAI